MTYKEALILITEAKKQGYKGTAFERRLVEQIKESQSVSKAQAASVRKLYERATEPRFFSGPSAFDKYTPF